MKLKKRRYGIPASRVLDGKTFKISLPLCKGKRDIENRKEWLKKKGYKHFRTFKEDDKIAVYASK